MTESQAIAAFAALSQETRLKIVRHLVVAGADGLAAGVVARKLGVTAANVSFHLKELERAGLVSGNRIGRSIIYRAAFGQLAELIRFLTEDCCSGHPEVCLPATALLPFPVVTEC